MKRTEKLLYIIVGVTLILLSLSSCKNENLRTLAISGKIYIQNIPAEGVAVTLTSERYGPVTTYTNAEGEYIFYRVWSGAYLISAAKEGYTISPDNRLVLVANTNITRQDFQAVITWEKFFGDTGISRVRAIEQTKDDGYILAGYTNEKGNGSFDFLIIKLDPLGNTEWEKTYGGLQSDMGYSIEQTSDSGYIVAGATFSYGAGNSDCWIVKLKSNGDKEWDKTFGGQEWDEARSIKETTDGNYIVAANTGSIGLDLSNAWILKLDSSGNKIVENVFSGTGKDKAYSIQETDNGYVFTGYRGVDEQNISDFWLLKIGKELNVEWSESYNKGIHDEAYSMQQTGDSGYVLAGYTKPSSLDEGNILIIKLDSEKKVQWEKTYGSSGIDKAYSIYQTSDSGYIATGYTHAYLSSGNDIIMIKLNASGIIEWQRKFEGSGSSDDEAYSIKQTKDGGYILAGETGPVGGNSRIWIMKLDTLGNINK